MVEYHDCREDKPLCRLPIIVDERWGKCAVRNPQVMGARGDEVSNQRRSIITTEQQYDVFLIGDNPGPNEDRFDLPFAGDSAKILCDFIKKAGFDLSKVYITNQVKCRTPKNRNAASAEKKACSHHLIYEFEKYKPKLVILLGNETLQLFNLNKEGGMRKIHGKVYTRKAKFLPDSPDFIVIPTYGPGYFVQREESQLQRRVLDDYVTAFHVLKSGSTDTKAHYVSKYKLCETVADVEEMAAEIKANGMFAWDTESPNAQHWRVPCILMQFSIGQDKNWLVPFYRHDPNSDGDWKLRPQFSNEDREKVHKTIASFFEDEDIVKCAHYAHYDINVIRRTIGCEVKGWVWDTMIVHRLLKEDPPHDLEYLADTAYGTSDYSAELHKIVGKGKKLKCTYDNIPDEILHPYGSNDVELCYRLMQDFYVQLEAKPNLMNYYTDEVVEAIYNFADMEYVGQAIDTAVTNEMIGELGTEIEQILLDCRSYTSVNFNPGAPAQVATELIRMGHGDKIKANDTASGYSTSKHILEEIDRQEVPFVGLIVDYRNRVKMRSTYAQKVIEASDYDGRARFSFKPFGTVTGRASAKVVHQIPKINEKKIKAGKSVYRDMFIEDAGFQYYYFDFSQIELYVFALLCGEQKLLDELATGDPHRAAAAAAMLVAEAMVSDYNRSHVGKPVGFGSLYGSGGYQLSKGVYENPITGKMEVIGERAYEFVKNYKRKYVNIAAYMDQVPEEARWNNCIVTSVFGLERHLPALNSQDDGKRGHAEREAINFVAQSAASSIMTRTMNIIRVTLKEYNIGLDEVRPLNTVHDSGAYGVRNELVEWFDTIVRMIASRPIEQLKDHCFKVKAGWGRSWCRSELDAH